MSHLEKLEAGWLLPDVGARRLDVTSTGFALIGFGIPPGGSPGDPLLLLPYLNVPLLTALLHTTWVVPPGRDAAQHHVFPLLYAPPPPGAVQVRRRKTGRRPPQLRIVCGGQSGQPSGSCLAKAFEQMHAAQ